MRELEKLIDRIIDRVNVSLRESDFDVAPYVKKLLAPKQYTKFYAFYGLTLHHPLHFHFKHSTLAGSYFLGKCFVDHSVLYKSDIRGDELKARGETFKHKGRTVVLHDDEVIRIKDSFLIKNLVHNNSHDPESPEEFLIQNTVSMHYANIHGSPVEGSFLGPFSTIDLTTVHDCIVGTYAYVQVGELSHRLIEPGEIWIRSEGDFDFRYRYPSEVLREYVDLKPGEKPTGILVDFIKARKKDFERVFEAVPQKLPIKTPAGASISPYAVVKGQTEIKENVLVAQRAYLQDAWLGKGSNAQENCYIIGSRLEGENITAHGGKVINAHLSEKVFVGFNSFLLGKEDCRLHVGKGSIIMPHTIIDLEEPVDVPGEHVVWGFIRNREDLQTNSISLEKLARARGELHLGKMRFQGEGSKFVEAFRHRLEHILEANGAYFDGKRNRGHAQKDQNISYNIIQPYPEGRYKGLYPTIHICP